MTQKKIKTNLIANLPDSSILNNFDTEGNPMSDDAANWLDTCLEVVESLVSFGMPVCEAISQVSLVAELTVNLN